MNRLNGLRCYLAGPIDYAEDDGVGRLQFFDQTIGNNCKLCLFGSAL